MSAKVYTQNEILDRLARDLPNWSHRDGFLVREFRTTSWKATMLAVGAVGHLAEAAWHHPDLSVSYARLEVRLQTHDAGGITDKDFELARRIESVVGWRPDGGGPPADQAILKD